MLKETMLIYRYVHPLHFLANIGQHLLNMAILKPLANLLRSPKTSIIFEVCYIISHTISTNTQYVTFFEKIFSLFKFSTSVLVYKQWLATQTFSEIWLLFYKVITHEQKQRLREFFIKLRPMQLLSKTTIFDKNVSWWF